MAQHTPEQMQNFSRDADHFIEDVSEHLYDFSSSSLSLLVLCHASSPYHFFSFLLLLDWMWSQQQQHLRALIDSLDREKAQLRQVIFAVSVKNEHNMYIISIVYLSSMSEDCYVMSDV